MSCWNTPCAEGTCPGLYFSDEDVDNCAGEVFEIYRRLGSGNVLVGDFVGLHYPYTSGNWLGCSLDNCAKATCPGQATDEYGFATEEKWYNCWGEVFRIYAAGKDSGDPIESGDDIFLYYLNDHKYVTLNTKTGKATCPGENRPPPISQYDTCYDEVFNIVKP